MERTQIYLTNEQKARIEAIARSKSISMAEVVRDAISQYLQTNEKSHGVTVLRDTFGAVPEWKGQDGVYRARQLRSLWTRSGEMGTQEAMRHKEEP